MEIRIFDSVLEKFIRSLEKSAIAKTLRAIDLLELFGPQLGMPHTRKITNRLFELRIRGHQEVRIFYTFPPQSAGLLYGFIKKSDKISGKEIRIAGIKLRALDKV